ncbi:hypothetical protein [Timonella sp. A28]|uniref:hypothetical protein n=1 Tax=Timonella sp. A28 TaxID=3442640 RepID=UPI003EBDC943
METLFFTALTGIFIVLIIFSFFIRRKAALKENPRAPFGVKEFRAGFDRRDRETQIIFFIFLAVTVFLWGVDLISA